MSFRLNCPECNVGLKVDAGVLGKSIQCPKCKHRFPVPRSSVPCPSCQTLLTSGAMVCRFCGYDFVAKRRKQREPHATFVPLRDPEPHTTKHRTLEPVSWGEIIATPLDVETVFTEAMVLSAYYVLWIIGINALTFIFSLGPIGWLLCSPVLAVFLRIWLISLDYDLGKAFLIGGGVFAFSLLVSSIITNALNVFGSQAGDGMTFGGLGLLVFVFSLFIVAIFGMTLRMASFFWGRYFAICDRAAHGALMSQEDSGGLVDLGYGIAVCVIGFGPCALPIWLTAIAMITNKPPVLVAAGLLWVFALMFAYFYVPMAIGVVALKRSLNPALVFQWAGRCMPDYLWFLIAVVPLHMIVIVLIAILLVALSATTVAGFLFAGILVAVPEIAGLANVGVIFTVITALVLSLVLGQYPGVVMMTALGKLLRRNESRLGWNAPHRQSS